MELPWRFPGQVIFKGPACHRADCNRAKCLNIRHIGERILRTSSRQNAGKQTHEANQDVGNEIHNTGGDGGAGHRSNERGEEKNFRCCYVTDPLGTHYAITVWRIF
jgi:hypothetical protein